MNCMLKTKIGFIGAGKVGVTLGAYFKSKGANVAGYASRSLESAKTAGEITGTHAYPDINRLAQECGVLFITTPDDEIASAWAELRKCSINGKIICHTSGALSSNVFESIADAGAYGYSVHPSHAFSKRDGSTSGLEQAYFAVEGSPDRLDSVLEFLKAIGNPAITINGGKKALYHLANVMASNLVLALLSMADDCMQRSGVEKAYSMKMMMPLILNNLEHIEESGFAASLTGPVERNDTETVARHLDGIPPQYGAAYSALSMKLIGISKEKHPERDYSKLFKQLNDYFIRIKKENPS